MSAILSAGCYSTKPIPHIRAEQCSARTEQNGIRAAAKPMETEEECKRNFGDNLVEENILPIYIRIENLSERNTTVLGGFNLTESSGRNWEQKGWAYAFGKKQHRAGLASALVPGPVKHLTFSVLAKNNQRMEIDYQSKSIPFNASVPANSYLEGFVYFEIPAGKNCREIENSELSFYLRGEQIEKFKMSIGDTNK